MDRLLFLARECCVAKRTVPCLGFRVANDRTGLPCSEWGNGDATVFHQDGDDGAWRGIDAQKARAAVEAVRKVACPIFLFPYDCLGGYDEQTQKGAHGIRKESALNDAKRLFEWV